MPHSPALCPSGSSSCCSLQSPCLALICRGHRVILRQNCWNNRSAQGSPNMDSSYISSPLWIICCNKSVSLFVCSFVLKGLRNLSKGDIFSQRVFLTVTIKDQTEDKGVQRSEQLWFITFFTHLWTISFERKILQLIRVWRHLVSPCSVFFLKLLLAFIHKSNAFNMVYRFSLVILLLNLLSFQQYNSSTDTPLSPWRVFSIWFPALLLMMDWLVFNWEMY